MSNIASDGPEFNSEKLALDYIAQAPGRHLFPIKAGAKFPPLLKDNLSGNCSSDPKQIRKWAAKWPGCNWGVALKKSNLFVVDVDCNAEKGKQGQKTFDDLDLLYGFPETEKVVTPSGGFHLYYEGEHQFALGVHGLGLDIDSPNYVLIEGCTFKDGTSYKRANPGTPTAPKPSWFADVIKSAKKERVERADEAAVEMDKPASVAWARDYLKNDAEPATEGQGGENTTLRVAMSLRDNGISEGMAFDLMNELYNVEFVCEPLWEPEELRAKIGNAYRYASLAMAGGKTAEAEFMSDDVAKIADSIPAEIMGNPEIAAEREALAQIEAKRDATEPAEKRWTKPEVIEEFVWIVDIERMMRRSNPTKMLKKSAFEAAFAYLAPKRKTFFDSLMSSTKGTTIRRFDELAYRPLMPAIIREGSVDCYNTWRPSPITAKRGDTSRWDAHLAYLFPNEAERNHLLNWLAGVIQHQNRKPKHALLLVGEETGTGKSFVAEVLSKLLGADNCQLLSQDILHNGFTGWALRTKLVIVEELRAIERAELKSKLHPWITQANITVNEKNLPTFKLDQVIAFFFMSNKRDAIEIDNTDRRYLVLETMAKPHADGSAYYRPLYALLDDPEALGAILHQLSTRKLKGYDIEGRAPETAAKAAMKAATANEVAQYMAENDGLAPFSYRVVTMEEIREALPHAMQNRASVPKMREAMRASGFLAWPEQIRPNGRHGYKPRVWVRALNFTGLDQSTVTRVYNEDHAEHNRRGDFEEDEADPLLDAVPPSVTAAAPLAPEPWD